MSHRHVTLVTTLVIAVGLAGPVAGLVAGATAVAVVVARRRARERGQRRQLVSALPTALDLLVVATDAGLTPHQTMHVLATSGPHALRPVFLAVLRRSRCGESLADALDEIPRRVGPTAVAATDALAIAQRHGAPLRPALTVVTAEAARQRRTRSEAAARRLPVLLSFPLVCCILPAFLLVAIAPAVLSALGDITTTGW
jgi:tight adherence protein C